MVRGPWLVVSRIFHTSLTLEALEAVETPN